MTQFSFDWKINFVFVFEFSRDELSQGEYDEMKEEFLDQMKEFSKALNRLTRGDLSMTSKISFIKDVSRHDRHLFIHQFFFTGSSQDNRIIFQHNRNDQNIWFKKL